jgi:hypothetical protein
MEVVMRQLRECYFGLVALILLCCPLEMFAGGAKATYNDLGNSLYLDVATPPTVVTGTATNITMYSAKLNGSANPQLFTTQGWFEWSLAPIPPVADSTAKQSLGFGSSLVPYNATITGLLPGRQYDFRAVAQNGDGRVAGSTVSFMTPPFTRDSAISRVISQVINPSPYKNSLIAFLYDPPGADSTLVSGYTIAPRDSQFVETLSGERWFFWIDLTGNIRFAHPCLFVTVDPATGSVEVGNGEWWPAITAPGDTTVQLWSSIDDRYSDEASIIYGSYGGIEIPPSIPPFNMTVPQFRTPELDETFIYRWRSSIFSGNTCGILVGGGAIKNGEQNAWQNDLDSMNTLLTTPPPGGGSPMASEVQMKNNATKADLKKMIDSAFAHGCNSIIFFYSGHGGKSGRGYMYLKDLNVSYDSLSAWLNQGSLKFKNAIFDDCYSGFAVPAFSAKPIPTTVITASDSTKTSSGSLTYYDRDNSNSLTPGDTIVGGKGKYTGAFMECWRKLRDSLNRNPTLKEIHDCVMGKNPDSLKEKQNPQYKNYNPPITFTLPIASAGHYDFLGTGVFIDFFNIGGPTNVTVTRVFEPPSGPILPEQYTIESLSSAGYWQITASPPITFVAVIGFEFNSELENIDPSKLLLTTRESPTIFNLDPFWDIFYTSNFNPGPGGGLMMAQNVTHFSEWSFATEASQITSVETEMNAKWNIVSVPMNVPDPWRTTLFPTATSSAFGYSNGYFSDDSLDECGGYWIKFDSAETVTFGGTQVLRDSCAVVGGWNILGSITKPVAVSDVTTLPPGIGLSSFFGYNGGYSIADSIRPGKGYWVKADADAQIVLDATSSALPKSKMPDTRLLNSLTITDAAGNKQQLYFGEDPGTISALMTEMPPLPPGKAFDARFASGRWIELHQSSIAEEKEFPVAVSGAEYPLTVSWNVNNGSGEYELSGIRKLNGEGSVKVDASTPLKLVLQGAGIPKEYVLEQNYPNPFNPLTVIRYQLPVESKVTLKIYNILGKEVTTVVDEQKAAGSHRVEVRNDGLASGVYFYKLQAGAFADVKKMVLMK